MNIINNITNTISVNGSSVLGENAKLYPETFVTCIRSGVTWLCSHNNITYQTSTTVRTDNLIYDKSGSGLIQVGLIDIDIPLTGLKFWDILQVEEVKDAVNGNTVFSVKLKYKTPMGITVLLTPITYFNPNKVDNSTDNNTGNNNGNENTDNGNGNNENNNQGESMGYTKAEVDELIKQLTLNLNHTMEQVEHNYNNIENFKAETIQALANKVEYSILDQVKYELNSRIDKLGSGNGGIENPNPDNGQQPNPPVTNPDITDVLTKLDMIEDAQVDIKNQLGEKANLIDVYNKTEIDAKLTGLQLGGGDANAAAKLEELVNDIATKVDNDIFEAYKLANDTEVASKVEVTDFDTYKAEQTQLLTTKADKTAVDAYKASNDSAVKALITKVETLEKNQGSSGGTDNGNNSQGGESKPPVTPPTTTTKRTITFNSNGGTGDMASIQVDDGSTYVLPSASFTAPAGKEFGGWDVGYAGNEITVDADKTFTVKWRSVPQNVYGYYLDDTVQPHTNKLLEAFAMPKTWGLKPVTHEGTEYAQALTIDNTPKTINDTTGNKLTEWFVLSASIILGVRDNKTTGLKVVQGATNTANTLAPFVNIDTSLGNEVVTPLMSRCSTTIMGGNYGNAVWAWSSKTPLNRKFYPDWTPSKKGVDDVYPVVDQAGKVLGYYPKSNEMRAEHDMYIAMIDYYYVLVSAGQSNSMAYGEGVADYKGLDAEDIKIKQLAHRAYEHATDHKSGYVTKYNDIIPLDHCPHDVQNTSNLHHPKADATGLQYGAHGHLINVAKKLLPSLPVNAGLLTVPCGRGGAAFSENGTVVGTFSATTGATENSTRWGVNTALYNNLITRTKFALEQNSKNKLLGVIWLQGEFDQGKDDYTKQPERFNAMVADFRTQLASVNTQCVTGDINTTPWLCGEPPKYWREQFATQYEVIWNNYAQDDKHIHRVVIDPATGTNDPATDPDGDYQSGLKYYGSGGRTNKNWTSATRGTHYSTKAHQEQVSDAFVNSIKTKLNIK